MKKEILTACSGVIFAASLMASPVSAEPKSYLAQAGSGEGTDVKYCAEVEVRTVANMRVKRTKCRTIAGWVNAGYTVDVPENVAGFGGRRKPEEQDS